MKALGTFTIVASLAIAGSLAVPVHAAGTHAVKSVSFKGTYKGTASLLISNSSVKIVSVTGTGKSSLVGTSTVTASGNGTGDNGQCVPFDGNGSLKGSTGSIKFSVVSSKSQGCSSGQSGPVTVTVTGTAQVKSGTGSAAGAKGSLKFNGTLKLADTSGSQSGAFKGTLTGTLKVK